MAPLRAVALLSLLLAGCSLLSLDGLSSGGAGGAGGEAATSSTGSGGGATTGASSSGLLTTASGSSTGVGGGGGAGMIVVKPELGAGGDGFLSLPDLCGTAVWDWYDQPGYKAIHAGRDNPCSVDVSYRAYLRFGIKNLGDASSATLRLYYASRAEPTAGVKLFEIDDFVTLGAEDWSAVQRADLGVVMDPATPVGTWIDVDVTARYLQAQLDGLETLAFELRYANEAEPTNAMSKWYGFASAENDNNQPRLVLMQ